LRLAIAGRQLVGDSLADGDSGTGGGDHNGNGDSQLLHERTPETHQNKNLSQSGVPPRNYSPAIRVQAGLTTFITVNSH
jgi:hypothetical protein